MLNLHRDKKKIGGESLGDMRRFFVTTGRMATLQYVGLVTYNRHVEAYRP